jgi:hypothetical protein
MQETRNAITLRAELARSGWEAEECVVPNVRSWDWLVTMRRGDRKVEARGTSQLEAWLRAYRQTEGNMSPPCN